jgi:UDP-N-acetylglucosamine 4,6-dehydratase
MAETLLSTEEMSAAIDQGAYFRLPLDKRTMNYQSGESRENLKLDKPAFTSDNTQQLSVQEVKNLLAKLL